MIEGYLEGISADGRIHGWARADSAGAAQVQVRSGGRVVAEGIAGHFRADLLRAGRGHGHHAFHLRLRQTLPPGRTTFELFLPRQNQRLGGATALDVPAISPVPVPVEALLNPDDGWTVPLLLAHPECLDLPGALAAMGPARFIDAVYRFVLDRWPLAEETTVWTRLLTVQHFAPSAFLVELLGLRERIEGMAALLSPHDARFGIWLT